MALLYILLLIISAITLYFFPTRQNYILFLLFVMLTFTMGLVYGVADYDMYSYQYRAAAFFDLDTALDYRMAYMSGYSKDIGINLLAYGFNLLGCSYEEYKFISSLIILGVLLFYVRRLTQNPLWVLFLYALYPFLMDIIQVKNSILEVLLFVSVYYYVMASSHPKTKYAVGMTGATLFHSASLAYIPFFIIDKILNNNHLRWLVYLAIIVGLLTPFYAGAITSRWMEVGAILSATESGLEHYTGYAEDIAGNRYIFRYLYVCMIVLISGFMNHRIRKYREQTKMYMKKYVNVAFHLTLYMCLFMPLFPIFTDASIRFPRNIMLILYVATFFYCQMEKVKLYRVFATVSIILSTIYMARVDLFQGATIDNVYIIFSNNYLFQLFDFL